MKHSQYRPRWAETVIFWGAGATASLGISVTRQQAQIIFSLAEKGKSLQERVKNAFWKLSEKEHEDIRDLLLILGDPTGNRTEIEEAMDRQLKGISQSKREDIRTNLKSSYDWEILYDLIQITPGRSSDTFSLQDLFNIIDMHIQNGQGFYVSNSLESEQKVKFIPSEKLIPARNALKMLILLIFSFDYQQSIQEKREVFEQYRSFAEILYQLMIEEGFRLYEEGKEMTSRDFYLLSYAVISMNWDPLLLWLIFHVNKEKNDSSMVSYIGNPPEPLKMFNDMGHFMGVRKIDGTTPAVWYPFNETVVQRVNDPEHVTGRRVRVGKFYFPHGSTGWRECPNCGKLTMYLGNAEKDWDLMLPSLFPPNIMESFRFEFKSKSEEEKEAWEKGQFSAIQCPFCGTMTETRHTPLVMQSSFKGNHPPFVEEIQRDMRVAVENAKHIVLMGYSLPTDDVIYRSILATKQNRNTEDGILCSIVVGYNEEAPDHWLEGEELQEYVEKLQKENPQDSFLQVVNTVWSIFGKKENKVRGYARGIPNVFIDDRYNRATREKVVELLYPTTIFPRGFVER